MSRHTKYHRGRFLLLSVALGLKSVGHSHVLGVSVVEFEHRHRFLISQRGVRAAEEFERFFVEASQTVIKRLVLGMRSRDERHSTTDHYVDVMARDIGLLGLGVELVVRIPVIFREL